MRRRRPVVLRRVDLRRAGDLRRRSSCDERAPCGGGSSSCGEPGTCVGGSSSCDGWSCDERALRRRVVVLRRLRSPSASSSCDGRAPCGVGWSSCAAWFCGAPAPCGARSCFVGRLTSCHVVHFPFVGPAALRRLPGWVHNHQLLSATRPPSKKTSTPSPISRKNVLPCDAM